MSRTKQGKRGARGTKGQIVFLVSLRSLFFFVTLISFCRATSYDAMAHITLLPYEIFVLIEDYLNKKELTAVSRTCRKLERHISPRFWKAFVLRPSRQRKYYPISALTRHAPSVHSLEYVGTPPRPYYSLVYPHLETLRVNLPMNNADVDYVRRHLLIIDNSTLVRLNPTITHLYVNSNSEDFATNSGFWSTVFETLKNPQRLDFHDFRVLQADDLDWFCDGLHSIRGDLCQWI